MTDDEKKDLLYSMNSRKIVFLDIDGTLTLPGRIEPPPSALRAIEAARRNGHLVFICTGRSKVLLEPLLRFGFDGYIGSAGGYICVGEQVIYDCPMTREQSSRAMRILKENGIYQTIECLDATYTDPDFVTYLKAHADELDNSEILRWVEGRDSTLGILPADMYDQAPVYKIVIVVPGPDDLIIPKKLLGKEFSFRIQNPEKGRMMNGELINRQFDKGRAVKKVCEHLGIPLRDSIAFGDSANDREMLMAAGLSVCMGNGSSEMKKISDMVCPPIEEDGLERAFTELGLK